MKHQKGWEQWFLLMADEHFDSKKCDRELLLKHHEQAKKRNAKILKFGDIFDCMGGKYDKRTTKEDIREEYQTQTYFTDIVKDAAKFYSPYKDNIILLSDGNHETSVKLMHEIDLLDNLRERLNPDYETNEKIFRGKYNGFIRFKFERETCGGSRSSKVMYYTHGSGGNSPVTKGVIKTNRRQETVFADFFVSAHIHNEWEIARTQARLNEQNNVVVSKVIHWQLPTYKNEFLSGGWADHKEFAPANIGCRWLRFFISNDNIYHESYLSGE